MPKIYAVLNEMDILSGDNNFEYPAIYLSIQSPGKIGDSALS